MLLLRHLLVAHGHACELLELLPVFLQQLAARAQRQGYLEMLALEALPVEPALSEGIGRESDGRHAGGARTCLQKATPRNGGPFLVAIIHST